MAPPPTGMKISGSQWASELPWEAWLPGESARACELSCACSSAARETSASSAGVHSSCSIPRLRNSALCCGQLAERISTLLLYNASCQLDLGVYLPLAFLTGVSLC